MVSEEGIAIEKGGKTESEKRPQKWVNSRMDGENCDPQWLAIALDPLAVTRFGCARTHEARHRAYGNGISQSRAVPGDLVP